MQQTSKCSKTHDTGQTHLSYWAIYIKKLYECIIHYKFPGYHSPAKYVQWQMNVLYEKIVWLTALVSPVETIPVPFQRELGTMNLTM